MNPVVSPDDSDTESEVSDVQVSDVSSVDVSSSSEEEEENDSDSDSSSSSSDSDDDSSDDDDQEAITVAKRKEAAQKAADAAAAAAAWTPKQSKKANVVSTPGSDGAQALSSSGKPFQRVDDQYWGDAALKDGGAMADNSYEHVFGNDGFGAKSSAKLLTTRGKRFQHEKTKRKRTFNGFSRTGGQISMASNSTKYNYSDED